MNILVVEDHPIVREVLVAVARHALKGSRVQAVADLESALEAARATTMDAVLLDLGLPGCEGVDSVKRFRAAFPSMVIVVVTGSGSSEDRERAVEAGCDQLLYKPVDPQFLESLLGSVRRHPR